MSIKKKTDRFFSIVVFVFYVTKNREGFFPFEYVVLIQFVDNCTLSGDLHIVFLKVCKDYPLYLILNKDA